MPFNMASSDRHLLARTVALRKIADAQEAQREAAKAAAAKRGEKYVDDGVKYQPNAPWEVANTLALDPFALPQTMYDRLQVLQLRRSDALGIPMERRNGLGYALRVNVFADPPQRVVTAHQRGRAVEEVTAWMELLGYTLVAEDDRSDALARGVRLLHVVSFDDRDFHVVVEEQVGDDLIVSDKPGHRGVRVWRSVSDCVSFLVDTFAAEGSEMRQYMFAERA